MKKNQGMRVVLNMTQGLSSFYLAQGRTGAPKEEVDHGGNNKKNKFLTRPWYPMCQRTVVLTLRRDGRILGQCQNPEIIMPQKEGWATWKRSFCQLIS